MKPNALATMIVSCSLVSFSFTGHLKSFETEFQTLENKNVAELSRSNMWFVIDGVIVTPENNCLKGITAKNVMKSLGNQSELKHCYRDIPATEIQNATEAFITSRLRFFENLILTRFHLSSLYRAP